MNQLMAILTQREVFLLVISAFTYVALFVLTVQNSKRKVLLLRQRLERARMLQQEQEAKSQQSIEQNRRRVAELEDVLRKLGSENSLLRLELEEHKARLDYASTMAVLENQKREQAEAVLFASDEYRRLKQLAAEGRRLNYEDWQQVAQRVNSVYTGFTEKLYSLYNMSEQDYHVCLLIKVRIPPKDIATLTAHSKESVASTRSRLCQKIFGRKGSTREWDDFILSL